MSRVPLEMTERKYLFIYLIGQYYEYCFLLHTNTDYENDLMLLIRLYFWSMSVSIGATLFTFFNFYVGYKAYRINATAITMGN